MVTQEELEEMLGPAWIQALRDEDGYIQRKDLPDHRTAGIVPMTFGKARIVITEYGNSNGLENGW